MSVLALVWERMAIVLALITHVVKVSVVAVTWSLWNAFLLQDARICLLCLLPLLVLTFRRDSAFPSCVMVMNPGAVHVFPVPRGTANERWGVLGWNGWAPEETEFTWTIASPLTIYAGAAPGRVQEFGTGRGATPDMMYVPAYAKPRMKSPPGTIGNPLQAACAADLGTLTLPLTSPGPAGIPRVVTYDPWTIPTSTAPPSL